MIIDYQLATPGPTRGGFLQLSTRAGLIGGFVPLGGDAPDVNLTTVDIGGLTMTCTLAGCGSSDFRDNTVVPFTLGQTFEFRTEMQIQATGLILGGGFFSEAGSGYVNFGFSMLDTDQSTPVALVQVPEAPIWTLLLLGTPTLWRLRRLRGRAASRL